LLRVLQGPARRAFGRISAVDS